MATPSWVKHFEEGMKPSGPSPEISKEHLENIWTVSGTRADLSDVTRQVYTTRSYSADYTTETDTTSSASKITPGIRNVHSSPACSVAEEEKKMKKRRRRRQIDDTSGYSTTSMSEMSEFESPRRKIERPGRNSEFSEFETPRRRKERPAKNELTVPSNNIRRESIQDDRSERSRVSYVSQTSRQSESEASKGPSSSRRPNEMSKSTSRLDIDRTPQRLPRTHSQAESVGSIPSVRSNQTTRSVQSKTPSNCITIRKDACSDDQIDPFAFIQPVQEPFSRKVRKIMGPCLGIFLMLILAASLGAAIYFAVELKKTQEDEIEMLRASLALTIKKTRYAQDLDALTTDDFKSLSFIYCQQMDKYYQDSHFKTTYRGCEVVSIKNELINFTLFFVEKEATKREIISVIESSAPKIDDSGQSVALVDKFEIELKNPKIKIEHKRTPVTFNKITSKAKTNPPKQRPPSMTIPVTDMPTTPAESQKTQEDEIEILRASVALTIKRTRYTEDLDALTADEFKSLAIAYCQQMDKYYLNSQFNATYRGCDVVSIKNEVINFMLFFLEKEATKEEIISVIKSSAPKVADDGQSVALVDKFEIELKNPKIKIEHKKLPVNFNKITSKGSTKTTEEKPTTMAILNKVTEMPTTPEKDKMDTKVITGNIKVTTKTDNEGLTTQLIPSESDLAWEPCAHKDGAFYPHPVKCNQYFQCEHGKSLLQTCVGDLVFDRESVVCVADRPGLRCPDASKAPPKPKHLFNKKEPKVTNVQLSAVETTKPILSNQTMTSSRYPRRPEYSRKPCDKGKPGDLFPHPDDCYRFIQCIGAKKGVVQKCATGLAYDPKTMTCVFPKNELICPDIVPCKGVKRGYHPHPTNCSQYIHCDSERVIIRTCSPGLIWDPTINSCVFRTANSICPDAGSTTNSPNEK